MDDEDHLDFITARKADPCFAVTETPLLSALTDEEIISHQYTDRLCLIPKQLLIKVQHLNMIPKQLLIKGQHKYYQINRKGILVRISTRDFLKKLSFQRTCDTVCYTKHSTPSSPVIRVGLECLRRFVSRFTGQIWPWTASIQYVTAYPASSAG